VNIDHYTDREVALAADLVNGEYTSADQLGRLLAEHHVSAIGRISAEELAQVNALRPRLRAVFEADDPAAAAAQVNALLAEAGALPQLSNHDGEAWHLHYTEVNAPLVLRLAAEAAMGLAIVMRDDGLERLKTCASPTCSDVFVDTSRNRSRRYCNPDTCGNRANVAAYRARRRAQKAS
jgi:predicted RNA-binding Zn ribbon-like protein